MRYHVLASDYDGTIAHNERVSETTMASLQKLKLSGRKLVLVTGREQRDLDRVFPEYKVFDYVVAENGAVLLNTATGEEELLGPAPDPLFVAALEDRGVGPLSVGKVIVATWEPHQHTALEVIKEFGMERQVIFNKGAVMILPPGINKATGLQALLQSKHLSLHNTVAVGDAENDSAMFAVAECAVAVSNALPTLKETVDFVTASDHGHGVSELIDELITNDLAPVDQKLGRHYLSLGTDTAGRPYGISPYRSGILVSGVSGGGKTTLTLSIIESLAKQAYQFCLIDPEGDYLELPGAVIVGNEKKLPAVAELMELLKNPQQSLVICLLSIPIADRPAFFSGFLTPFLALRKDYGHPHWLLVDEAHHLAPAGIDTTQFGELNNFTLISLAPGDMCSTLMSKVGLVISVGDDPSYPFDQVCDMLKKPVPARVPPLEKGQACIWNLETKAPPLIVQINPPQQLLQRHKKKYAQGDMADNSFVFTGARGKLQLKANNLMMFVHLAEGVDDDTWRYHLKKGEYSKWFKDKIHDEELAAVAAEAEAGKDAAATKKVIVDYINQKYTG